jgi:DNA-binding transcriptional MerR regulator
LDDSNPINVEYHRRRRARTLVHRGDAFDVSVAGVRDSPDLDRILSGLRRKRFTLGRSETSSRVVNHWEAEGVVQDPREEGKGWRRYSILDLTWLSIVRELRSFGLSTETLRAAQRDLNSPLLTARMLATPMRPLEFYVIRAMRREPVYFFCFAGGDVELATEREYALTGLIDPIADHVRIALNPLIQRFLPKLNLKADHEPGVVLTDKETSVLLALRDRRNSQVTVRMKGGVPDHLESRSEVEGRRIIDLLDDGPFLDLTVKQRDGKVVSMTRVLQEKL